MFRKHPFLCHSTHFIDLSVTAFAVPPPLIQGEAYYFVDSLRGEQARPAVCIAVYQVNRNAQCLCTLKTHHAGNTWWVLISCEGRYSAADWLFRRI